MIITYQVSNQDMKRSMYIEKVEEKKMTVNEAAEILQVSERQMYRILSRYRSQGIEGLLHRLRGRRANNAYGEETRKEVIRLYIEQYSDYGPTLFAEKLESKHEIELSRQTVTRWLASNGLWSGERRKRLHRKRRMRRSSIGSLIQFDGSDHDWFEGRGAACCLLVGIDDASNRVMLRFVDVENTDGVLRFWHDYVSRYGIPAEVYTDKGAVYFDPKDAERLTSFGKALARLGIRHIRAHSPQAKGRVERSNRTHQDRLLKALREQNISTIEAANEYLEKSYTEEHNRHFAWEEGLEDIHRSACGIELRTIFCIEEIRHVYNDWTITLAGKYYQLVLCEASLPPPRSKVVVQLWLDGTLHIYWHEHELAYEALASKPRHRGQRFHTPGGNHPWRNKTVGGLRGRLRGEKTFASKHGEKYNA